MHFFVCARYTIFIALHLQDAFVEQSQVMAFVLYFYLLEPVLPLTSNVSEVDQNLREQERHNSDTNGLLFIIELTKPSF